MLATTRSVRKRLDLTRLVEPTVWTTLHLRHEREAAELLGIPFEEVMQAALIPVAYTIGTDFRPAARAPLDAMVHWDRW